MLCCSTFERWDTPISTASSIVIETIEADGYLSITLRAAVDNDVLLICFSFLNYHWYQIKRFASMFDSDAGRTQIHTRLTETESSSSKFFNLSAFRKAFIDSDNCLLNSLPDFSNHFLFIEDKSEIEVISSEKPKIILIGKSSLSKSA